MDKFCDLVNYAKYYDPYDYHLEEQFILNCPFPDDLKDAYDYYDSKLQEYTLDKLQYRLSK